MNLWDDYDWNSLIHIKISDVLLETRDYDLDHSLLLEIKARRILQNIQFLGV